MIGICSGAAQEPCKGSLPGRGSLLHPSTATLAGTAEGSLAQPGDTAGLACQAVLWPGWGSALCQGILSGVFGSLKHLVPTALGALCASQVCLLTQGCCGRSRSQQSSLSPQPAGMVAALGSLCQACGDTGSAAAPL